MAENNEKTLFGEVALRMARSPEDIATESLCYILQQYEVARQYFLDLCEKSGVRLPDTIRFATQDSTEGHRPDLVGIDSQGQRSIVVESKFWAGLTANQPTTYLKSLPSEADALLLFIVPARRFETLWPKLRSISTSDGFTLSDERDVYQEFRICDVSPNHRLAQISWRVLVAGLISMGEAEGVLQLVADARQLQGLCERMDGESFLPLTDSELSPAIGRRIQQLYELIDDVVNVLRNRYSASTKNLKTGGKGGEYGRFFLFADTGMFLGLSPRKWARHGETPLWLNVTWQVAPKSWVCPGDLAEALRSAYPLTNLVVDANETSLPVDLPVGVERDEVIDSVCKQVMKAVEISNRAKSGLMEDTQ